MNRILIIFTFLFLTYVTYGFYLSQFEFDFFQSEKISDEEPLFYNYRLQQNIYTQESIGSGTIYSISEEAKKAHSKFVLFTDLNPLIELPNDAYLAGVGQLYGAKVVDNNEDYTIYSHKLKQLNSLLDYKRNNSLVIKVDTYRSELLKPSIPNRHLRDGYDVVNLKRLLELSWKNEKLSTIWSLLCYPFNPKLALIRLFKTPDDAFAYFDHESLLRKTNLYLSSEATAKAIPLTNWLIRIPTYYQVLSLASQRILIPNDLTGNIKEDSELIANSLKQGRFYISMDTVGDSTGFEVYAKKNETDYYMMGDTIPFSEGLNLHFKLPYPPTVFHEVILYKNGVRFDHLNTLKGYFRITEPGVYRLEVRISTKLPLPDAIKWIPWIYTNNFYVR